MSDDLDVMLREYAEGWRRDIDGAAGPTVRRRRHPVWVAATVSLAGCLVLAVVIAAVLAGRRGSPRGAAAPGSHTGVMALTNRGLITIDRAGRRVVTPLDQQLDIPPGPQPFRAVGSRILGLAAVGPEQHLVSVTSDGHVQRLVDPPVSGYAISWDHQRIAWSEPHRDPDGYVRSTDFVEASFPGLVELERTKYSDDARIDGYSGHDLVYFDAGDGAGGRAGFWSTTSGVFADLAGYGHVVAANAEGRIVATEGDGVCARIGTVTEQVVTDGRLTGMQPLDCRGGTAVSPDGSLVARIGRATDHRQASIAFYRFSDGQPVGVSTLGITKGSGLSMAWSDASSVVVRSGAPAPNTITRPSVTLSVSSAKGGSRPIFTAARDPQSVALVAASRAVPPATVAERVTPSA